MNSNLKQLPVDERIRLVEDLWDSIASDQNAIALTSDQKAKLDKCLDAYESTRDSGRPMGKVIAGIHNKS
jgi:putative addiction module component (TIGR02574 family)